MSTPESTTGANEIESSDWISLGPMSTLEAWQILVSL